MLISHDKIYNILNKYKITVNGVFHIGAHECEEIEFYKTLKVTPQNIVWVEAIEGKVNEAKIRGILNVYNAVITDKDDENVLFNISCLLSFFCIFSPSFCLVQFLFFY